MPKRVTMAVSLTWHELEVQDVLPIVDTLARMLKGTGVQVDIPDPLAKQLSDETRRSLGMVSSPLPRGLMMGEGYQTRTEAYDRTLRQTLEMWQANGRNTKIVAEQMGVDRNTIYNRLARARQRGLMLTHKEEGP